MYSYCSWMPYLVEENWERHIKYWLRQLFSASKQMKRTTMTLCLHFTLKKRIRYAPIVCKNCEGPYRKGKAVGSISMIYKTSHTYKMRNILFEGQKTDTNYRNILSAKKKHDALSHCTILSSSYLKVCIIESVIFKVCTSEHGSLW